MHSIWKTRPDSLTITIEQNVQFQVGIYRDKSILDQIQNGPATTFNFNMHNNWKTLRDIWTFTIEPNVWFQEEYTMKIFNFTKFKMTFDFTMLNSEIARSLLLNKRCSFREGNVLKKNQLDKI